MQASECSLPAVGSCIGCSAHPASACFRGISLWLSRPRARQGAPRVPGMDDSELDAAKDAAGGRAPAARRRRPKKAADPATEPAAASTDTAAAEMTRLKLAEPAQAASSSSQPEAAPEHDPDKLARSLRKKLAACEALTSRKAAGESLTGPELDKLAKAVGWQRELEELQTAQ